MSTRSLVARFSYKTMHTSGGTSYAAIVSSTAHFPSSAQLTEHSSIVCDLRTFSGYQQLKLEAGRVQCLIGVFDTLR
ncbi:hypothetical protein RRG08_053084 [Elysia crispata]|uniref:Uncharacterized protein n=1 Tax=Elysia crispata TaxID=231223 RepID=A0AAE1B8X3_9GAST|nr:hypothetical protein RRG08_053084 [Elysia crispata]